VAAECGWGLGYNDLRVMLGGFPVPRKVSGAASSAQRAEVARRLNELAREVTARTPGGGVGGRVKAEGNGWRWVGSGGRRGGGAVVPPPLHVSGGAGRARVTFGVVTQSGWVVDKGRVVIPEINGVPLDEGPVLEYPKDRAGWVMMRLELEFTQEEVEEVPNVFRSGLVREAVIEWHNGEAKPEDVYADAGGSFYVPMAVAIEESGKWRLEPLMQTQVRVQFAGEDFLSLPIVGVFFDGWVTLLKWVDYPVE
jgi:hypothetical protein